MVDQDKTGWIPAASQTRPKQRSRFVERSLPTKTVEPSCFTARRLCVLTPLRLPLFEIALAFTRFDHIASRIINADHSTTAVVDCVSQLRDAHVLHNFHDHGKAPAPNGNSHP